MKLDTRNPFASWGFEEEKYAANVAEGDDSGINKLEGNGFINETVIDEAYNKVAEPMTADKYSEQHTDQMSFFTNNENMLPTELQNKAYGNNQELQREYPAGESLNYYGNEADDLKLYGDAEESGDDEEPTAEPEPEPEPTPEPTPEPEPEPTPEPTPEPEPGA
jgi:outer membrane biosynthesis protein TonB